MIHPRESPVNLTGDKLQYRLYFDTMADYPNLPGLDKAAPGSDATCLDTGDVYILRGDTGTWEVL